MNKMNYDEYLGKQINYFTILEIIKNSGGASFKVKCICGKELIHSANRILTNHSKSCGCKHWGGGKPSLRGKPAHNKENLTGQKFGKLIVIKVDPNHPPRKTSWICQCECGNSKSIRAINLKLGHTKSCGCEHFQTNNKHPSWKGYEGISGSEWCRIRNGAINRGLKFEITIEKAWQQFLDQKKKCVLTGLELIHVKNKHSLRSMNTASLDRIDNNLGYIEGNIQWVCKTINMMKNISSQTEFINYCTLVADYENKKTQNLYSESEITDYII